MNEELYAKALKVLSDEWEICDSDEENLRNLDISNPRYDELSKMYKNRLERHEDRLAHQVKLVANVFGITTSKVWMDI